MSKPYHADPSEPRPSPLRIAVHGILAEGAGSGAGTFPVLLAGMLERGHHVDVFGVRGFNEPKSLERFEHYRFVGLRLPRLERLWWRAAALKTPYPLSAVSQLAQLGWQHEALRQIEQQRERYDLVFCTDALELWRSTLPVVSWPQSPPHTEAAALRSLETGRRVVASSGPAWYVAVQIFYAYRWLCAKVALRFSDVYLCGSRWARDEWERFGADRSRLRTMSYLIDLDAFAGVPPLGAAQRPLTFLWLGRATPRKRLELFLEGFAALRQRQPGVRARLVGNLLSDPFAARILEPHLGDRAISIEAPVSRSSVPGLFGEVDVLVQPSENENFGFSVAEALAAGRPVVLGPTNGTSDYVGEAGFAFSAYQPHSVADAMERAMKAVVSDGPGLSSKARVVAREYFTPSRVVTRFEDVCRGLLARRAGSSG